MQQFGNPDQGANNPGQTGRSAGEQNDKLNVSNTPGETGTGSDAYKRDGVHLGDSASGTQDTDTGASTQKGGGGTGYDVSREQQEVNREREEMQQERNQDDLQVERTQTPRPETDPGRENPGTNPSPGTSTMG